MTHEGPQQLVTGASFVAAAPMQPSRFTLEWLESHDVITPSWKEHLAERPEPHVVTQSGAGEAYIQQVSPEKFLVSEQHTSVLLAEQINLNISLVRMDVTVDGSHMERARDKMLHLLSVLGDHPALGLGLHFHEHWRLGVDGFNAFMSRHAAPSLLVSKALPGGHAVAVRISEPSDTFELARADLKIERSVHSTAQMNDVVYLGIHYHFGEMGKEITCGKLSEKLQKEWKGCWDRTRVLFDGLVGV